MEAPSPLISPLAVTVPRRHTSNVDQDEVLKKVLWTAKNFGE